MQYRRDPLTQSIWLAFRVSRARALRKGATWNLTFDEYRALWPAHSWIGRRRAGRLLSLIDPAGAYELGNVCINSRADRTREQHARARAKINVDNASGLD